MWYLSIQAAKAIPEGEAAADQLACEVLRAQGFGAVSRVGSGMDMISREQAITSTGQQLWLDLPFLLDALRSAWAPTSSDMTAIERRNLAGFKARLASFGIYTDELMSCALGSFAGTLETSSEVKITDQVPVLFSWLRHGGFAILSASAHGFASLETEAGPKPGELFTRHNAEADTGFTIARWDFWKQRFDELQQGSDSDTAKQLQQCAGMMRSPEEIIGARGHARDDALKAYFKS